MRIVGRQLEANPEAKLYMDVYFDRVAMISMDVRLGSHIRIQLQASLQVPC